LLPLYTVSPSFLPDSLYVDLRDIFPAPLGLSRGVETASGRFPGEVTHAFPDRLRSHRPFPLVLMILR